jgi:hypothetical protein
MACWTLSISIIPVKRRLRFLVLRALAYRDCQSLRGGLPPQVQPSLHPCRLQHHHRPLAVLSLLLHDLAEFDLQGAREIQLQATQDNPGGTTLATLGSRRASSCAKMAGVPTRKPSGSSRTCPWTPKISAVPTRQLFASTPRVARVPRRHPRHLRAA